MANIVLAHGILGFDEIGVAGFSIANYFNGVAAKLEEMGHSVCVPDVSSVGTVVLRAGELEKQVIDFCDKKKITERSLHIIAHSMGGLDARHALAQSPLLSRLTNSLVTLGTPHKGSPVADFLVKRAILAPIFYRKLLKLFGGSVGGLKDLTKKEAKKFDLKTVSIQGIMYFSIAGTNQTDQGSLFFKGLGMESLIGEANDGVVSFESANKVDDGWKALPQWPVDHAGLIGWFDIDPDGKYYNDHIKRYVALAKYLSQLKFK